MKSIKTVVLVFMTATMIVACGGKKGASKSGDKTASSKSSDKKDGIQPYSKVITKEAKSDPGLFIVHMVDDKYYYEIPDSLLNREMLMVTRIAKTATGIGFGGGKANTQTLRWQRKNDNILLTHISA